MQAFSIEVVALRVLVLLSDKPAPRADERRETWPGVIASWPRCSCLRKQKAQDHGSTGAVAGDADTLASAAAFGELAEAEVVCGGNLL
ncbi:hypothetical protein MRB53_037014 [Persea americana]|nr:hypothetical protein MRB53_037014 [Persea americana]